MSYAASPRIVEVTTVPTLVSNNVNFRSRIFRNLSSVSIFLGGADVTADTTKGWELPAGEDFPDSISNGAIWAIVASGTEDLQVWEVTQ